MPKIVCFPRESGGQSQIRVSREVIFYGKIYRWIPGYITLLFPTFRIGIIDKSKYHIQTYMVAYTRIDTL